MLTNFVIIFFIFYIASKYASCGTDLVGSYRTDTEYCQFESFNPKCSPNEVVLIKKALFGRMNEGRCITEKEIKSFGHLIHDPKYLGCHVDVFDLVSKQCSLENECVLKVSDTSLNNYDPCSPGLRLHLEAEYTCISVYRTEDTTCRVAVSQIPRHFLPEALKSERCGRKNYPWILEAAKGQKISISLISITSKNEASLGHCNDLGIIIQDGLNGNNSTVCKTGWSEDSAMLNNAAMTFKSSANVVKMFVTDTESFDKKFVLKLEAEGCLDIIPPEDTWLKRNGDDIVIGCYSSKQTWYLRCENRQWSGVVGNCSSIDQTETLKESDNLSPSKKIIMPKSQQILVMVSICGMGVVICSVIICVGAVCARRYKLNSKANHAGFFKQNFIPPDPSYTYNAEYPTNNYKFDNGLMTNGKESLIRSSLQEHDQTYFILEENGNAEVK